MSGATLMNNLQPQTNRKIRDDVTNSLRNPDMYDLSASQAKYEMADEEAKPLMKPRFFHRQCESTTPVYHPFTRETGLTRLLYCINGQGLLIGEEGETQFLTGGSIVVIPHDKEFDLLLGRGTQNWITAHWEPESCFVPETKNIETNICVLNDCSSTLRNLTKRVIDCSSETPDWPNFMVAWLNLMIHESHVGKRTFHLTPKIGDGVENLSDLVQAIKESPEGDWNLNAASRYAGYSPFHLSRVFRSVIGVGLPKFVESCRTEVAVDRLLNSDDPINIVADECGFGSSQAMRAAIREYTGFLPIELRGRSGE